MKSKLFNLTVIITFVIITAGCSKKPGSVVTDFLTAKSWDEKKEFIYDAKGLSEEKLAAYMLSDQIRIQEVRHVKKIEDGIDVYRLSYNTPNSSTNSFLDFLVRKKDDVENIDFKPMIGYNEIDLSNYAISPLPEPATVRCFVEKANFDILGDYINISNIEEHIGPTIVLSSQNSEYNKIKEQIDHGNKRIILKISKWKYFPHILGGITVVANCTVLSPDWIER